ncbi:hypothetical protein [uncultured Oscillibacter sp.]|uniref:hypothetical protein n=1 Tax=uncultured Oscillibacter sp. TaxID=876091 RepID=UPI00260084B3|nr:hypothetical protein [uncultured Oscillibacter sp.]
MDGQILFPFEDANHPKYLDADQAAKTRKALDLLASFQASRFAVYGKAPHHKNFHPTAPSRGLYNCGLVHQERYKDQETAQRIADILTRDNPGWAFQVRVV